MKAGPAATALLLGLGAGSGGGAARGATPPATVPDFVEPPDPALRTAVVLANGETTGSPHRGGTLRLTADGGAGTADPQVNYNSEMITLQVVAYDGLTAFAKLPGSRSDRVVPDLAEAIPEPQDGGLTYVFRLRRGVRFSDGREVGVRDVVASFRRLFRVHSPTAGGFYGGIVGAADCLKDPDRCALPGVVGDAAAGTVTFHLVRPDAEFMDKLAFPHAYVLPADTPARDLGNDPPPGTGPYRISSYDPNRGLDAVRNPFFRVWAPEAQPDGYVDRISYSFGLSDEAEVTAVENGTFDNIYDFVPLDRYAELGARYTDQVHINPLFGTYYLAMNVNLSPFDDVRVRRAVNYAVNRRAMQIFYGGPAAATVLCRNIPEGLPGHEPGCPYTVGADPEHPAPAWTAPDLGRARALVAASGHAGEHVTLVVANRAVDIAMGTDVRNTLQKIGFDADVKPISFAIQFTFIQNTSNKVQISLTDWFADYPEPSDFTTALFGCENFHPGSDSSVNISGYCSPAFQRAAEAAAAAQVTDRAKAGALWAAADRILDRDAPAAPLIQFKKIDLVSKRLGNFFYTDLYHMLFSQVWVR